MFNVLVTLSVFAARLDEFLVATLEMAHPSLLEPGCRRFEVLRRQDLPTAVVLHAVFNSEADAALHVQTEHYRAWRRKTEAMLAEPMQTHTYTQLF